MRLKSPASPKILYTWGGRGSGGGRAGGGGVVVFPLGAVFGSSCTTFQGCQWSAVRQCSDLRRQQEQDRDRRVQDVN